MAASGGGGGTKGKSARRKISLPWFRQASSAGPALSRQHTIDTPSSFHKRLLSRQTTGQTGGVEMTWVINDHVASGPGQLSVSKGQQVEVVDVVAGQPDWRLVKMPSSGLDPPPEGIVPVSVLKQPPASAANQPPAAAPAAPRIHDLDPGTSEGANLTSSSPVNKRRVFSGRKWLPQPLRKLSGAKVEKSSPPDRPVLKKTPSDKRFKNPVPEASKAGTEGTEEAPRAETNGEENEEEVLELPPPMAPISEPILVPTNEPQTLRTSTLSLEGATSADLAEIEQIVKERMEQHSEKQSKLTSTVTPDQVSTSSGEGESALQKREYVIQELVDTERDYVRDLKMVVEGYMALMRDPNCEIPIPEDLAGGKDKMVFGNLEAIYEWHRDTFLKSLERCIDNPIELGPLFKRYERKLFMYVVYCQNKPVSEFIVSEFDTYFEELRVKLGHKLQLCDYLIKPVQRLMKYQLLLRDLYKYTERAKLPSETETLRQALVVMQVVPKAANDMMDVGRLQGFDGKITAQGKLLLHGPLVCAEGASLLNFKGKELIVFLFEQNIIFSEGLGKKTQFQNPTYFYKAHIQVNKMSLEEGPIIRDKTQPNDDNEPFVVRSTDPKKPSLAYTCQALSSESRAEWLLTLKNILQTQRDFLKAIQSPIAYQKELTKDPSVI